MQLAMEMTQQKTPVTTTLKNISKIFAKMDTDRTPYNFVYVKDGVANVTDKKNIFIRFEVQAPDGQYDIDHKGQLVACTRLIEGPFSTRRSCPLDPEIVRPPFESMKPWCSIDPMHIPEFLFVIQKAIEREEKVYVEKTGLGLKRTGEIYHEYPFNIPYKLEFHPLLLGVAFTDALRYPSIEMYQEIWREHGEMPQTPLVIGFGWKNCSLLTPIIDQHRSYYN